ncbi:MAG: DUF4340 domain-containing protein [Arenicellales bacterium]|nr:DUF4340 domain-containing protein [Arenicellales bacterium]
MLTKKGFIVLLGITVLVIVAAVVTRQSEESSNISTEGPYFPDLLQQSNEVAIAIIKDSESTTTLKKKDDQWIIDEKDGYPASTAQVRELILGLARLQRLEAKTKNPELYNKLEVNDIGEPGSNSKLVRLKGASGSDLAVVIVGKEKVSRGGTTKDQLYVRAPGDAQSWLVEGLMPALGKATDWLDKTIIKPKVGEVRSVTVDSSTDSLVVARENTETTDFTVQELGPDEEVESQYAINQIVQSFKDLRLEDVKAESALDLSSAESSRAILKSFDGAKIELDIHKQGEQVFGQLHATYQEPDESDEVTKQSVSEKVEQWNAAWDQWVYELPSYQVENIMVTKEELIKKTPDEEEKE